MLQYAGGAPSSHPKKIKYKPPEMVNSISVAALLKGSPREAIGENQLELLEGVTVKNAEAQSMLFVAGDVSLLKRRCIAIIGTRHVSDDGRKRANRLARELVERGVVVTSGLADGVDTAAMKSAIDNGGKTIGVIGTPLSQAYPAANARLQEEVYRHHLLISQFPEGSRVFPSNFPTRNRTMALLSDASVVIEASDTSGTLHQAIECQKLGRWLGIAKNVVENPSLTWPKKFLSYKKCFVLESTEALIQAVYGD